MIKRDTDTFYLAGKNVCQAKCISTRKTHEGSVLAGKIKSMLCRACTRTLTTLSAKSKEDNNTTSAVNMKVCKLNSYTAYKNTDYSNLLCYITNRKSGILCEY